MSVHLPDNGLVLGLQEIGRKMTFDWSAKSGDAGIRIIDKYYSLQ
jgi:hypothetical protein